jgi:myxalamid-type polyketide synthase MxaE and MxaD
VILESIAVTPTFRTTPHHPAPLPPHLHLQNPNRYIRWKQLPVVVPTQLTPWLTQEESRLAGISSFGMSGTNVHLIVEENNR